MSNSSDLDMVIGARVRLCRQKMALSMGELGLSIGVSHEQVQKYETGANSIGAGQLCLIALALNVPLSTFFENIDNRGAKTAQDGNAKLSAIVVTDELERRLVEAFRTIAHRELREMAVGIISSIQAGLDFPGLN